MWIAEVLPLERYYNDPRFDAKKPVIRGTWRKRCGDNMYFKDDDGEWKRRCSVYHRKKVDMLNDLNGRNVLIADHFYYFGKNAVEIPPKYNDLLVLRGYKHRHDPETVKGFLNWLKTSFKPGIHGDPHDNSRCDGC